MASSLRLRSSYFGIYSPVKTKEFDIVVVVGTFEGIRVFNLKLHAGMGTYYKAA